MATQVQAATIELTPWQIENLSKPLVKMFKQYEEFFKDPENEKGFNEWLKQNPITNPKMKKGAIVK